MTMNFVIPVDDFRIFRDEKRVQSEPGFLHFAMSNAAPGVVRLCVISKNNGVAAEIAPGETLRARSELQASALSVRVAGDVIHAADRLPQRGELTVRLGESFSHDVVHLAICRLQTLLAEIEIRDMRLLTALKDLAS